MPWTGPEQDIGRHRKLDQDDVTGYLFPPDNPQDLADRAERVLAQRDE